MRAKLKINDVHIGVSRVAGTTPASAFALRQYLLHQFRDFLLKNADKDVIINGDLFDSFEVPLADLIALYLVLVDFLCLGDGDLVLVPGNHDVAKDDSRRSTFDVLCAALGTFPGRARVIREPTMVWPGHYVIPHVANQQLLDEAIEEAAALAAPCYVYFHANRDNGFAVESDHSLNVSQAQIDSLTKKGLFLLFSHEHQAGTFDGVRVCGNQWPSSVADCLNNPQNKKYALVIEPDGSRDYTLTWEAEGSYLDIDWRKIEGTDFSGLQFIRVSGPATAQEAALAMSAVSKLRQKSDAFVVSNAVKIQGQNDLTELQTAADDLKTVNILEYLYEQLDPAQKAKVQELLAKEAA